MFTTWELIYSQLQHRQSLPLPRNRYQTVSNNVYRAMPCTISFRRMIAKNQPTKLTIMHRTVSFRISVRYRLGRARI